VFTFKRTAEFDVRWHLLPRPQSLSIHRKAFKSTEAYRYFTSGWVNDPGIYHLEMKKMFLITGRVSGTLLLAEHKSIVDINW